MYAQAQMTDYDDTASRYVFQNVFHRSKDSYCVLLQQFQYHTI